MLDEVESFCARLDPELRQTVDGIRSLVRQSVPGLTERIKWNAPSFAVGDDDRITLGIERKGGVRIVFHRGAKPKPVEDFHFDDPTKLATWVAPDRGIVIFRDRGEVEARGTDFTDLCKRWAEATS